MSYEPASSSDLLIIDDETSAPSLSEGTLSDDNENAPGNDSYNPAESADTTNTIKNQDGSSPSEDEEIEGSDIKSALLDLIHLHSHLFRRTRAMHLYQAGVPLATVSEWLGHSSIETTRFYAKVTEDMKREALHRLSDSDSSAFKNGVAFKYANDEDVIKRLCGLK